VRFRVIEDSTTHLRSMGGRAGRGVALCCHRDGRTAVLQTVTRQRERGVVCCCGGKQHLG